jgi:glycosyltransferase involved in cell wall biosynthesis
VKRLKPPRHRVVAGQDPPGAALLVDDLVQWIEDGLQPTGIQRVVSELVNTAGGSLPAVATAASWRRVGLVRVAPSRLVWHESAPSNRVTSRPSRPVGFLKRVLPFRLRMALRSAQHRVEVIEKGLRPIGDGLDVERLLVVGSFWSGTLPERICRLADSGIALSMLVYDTIPLDHPEWFTPAYCKSFRESFERLIPMADRVVTLSDEVAHRLGLHFPAASATTMVAVPGLSAHAKRITVEAQPGPRILLAPGTVEPRKNHRLVLDAWALARKDPRLSDARLVICGRRGWQTEEIENEIQRDAERLQIVRVDYATDLKLERLYASSAATVHASVDEGLGLPPRESVVRGIPTLMSTLIPRDGMPEGTYDLFSPTDVAGLAQLIVQYLAEPRQHRPLQVETGTGWEPVLRALMS